MEINEAIETINTFFHTCEDYDTRTNVTSQINSILVSIPELTRQCTGCKRPLTREKFNSASGSKYNAKARKVKPSSWLINQPCKECLSINYQNRKKEKSSFYDPKRELY